MLISSKENRLIKEYTGLREQKSQRREKKKFVVEGARLCGDAVLSGAGITAAFVSEKAGEKYAECLSALEKTGAPLYSVSTQVAEYLADTRTTQGIFLIAEQRPESLSLETLHTGGAYLALENIQDPGNLGTILRTAEAMGVDGVILSTGCTDIYSPKAVRASMGAVFRLPFLTGADMPQTVGILKQRGIKVCAAVASGGKNILETDLSGSVCAIIGNEGNGLTDECVRVCSEKITVKMRGRAESLNAAAAATVVIWEMTRLRT